MEDINNGINPPSNSESTQKKPLKPDFFLISVANEALRIPITQERNRIGRYTCQFNDNRLSRNQAEVWSDGKHCFFRQIGVNPCAIKPSGCVVGIVAEGVVVDEEDEIALAHVPPDVRGCVRTTSNLVYVLEENFTVFMLATSEADLAPFRLVAATKKSNVQPSPKPTPPSLVQRAGSSSKQINPIEKPNVGNVYIVDDAYDDPVVDYGATPTKRIKLNDDPAIPESQNPAPDVDIAIASLQTQEVIDPNPPDTKQAAGAAPPQMTEAEACVAAVLPQIPLDAITRALAELNGNVQEATEALLLNPDKFMSDNFNQDSNSNGNERNASQDYAPASSSSTAPYGSTAASSSSSAAPTASASNQQQPPNIDNWEIILEEEDVPALRPATSQRIDEVERQLAAEEEDRKLAERMYHEEVERLKQVEEEKKKAAEFDAAFDSIREELERQNQLKIQEFEREKQTLQLQLEELRAQRDAAPVGAAGPPAVVKKEVEFPAQWNAEASGQSTHVLVEVPHNSEEFLNIANRFLSTVAGRTFYNFSVSLRTNDSIENARNYLVGRIAIRKIKRNQNVRLWGWYYLKREEIALTNEDVAANEVFLFHGTNPVNINTILREGLDPRVSNMAGAIGAGVYFAEQANVSLDYINRNSPIIPPQLYYGGHTGGRRKAHGFANPFGSAWSGAQRGFGGGFADPQGQQGQDNSAPPEVAAPAVDPNVAFAMGNDRRVQAFSFPSRSEPTPMLYCRVSLGSFTQGQSGLRRPPQRPGSTRLFDSVSGSLNGSRTFCVFDVNQIYPEYVIYFENY